MRLPHMKNESRDDDAIVIRKRVRIMTFETERLILRPWHESDAECLYEYAKDPQIGPMAGWPVHTSVDESREIIKNVLSLEGTYAVCLKENDELIGCIGLKTTSQTSSPARPDEIEIGYWVGQSHWGHGYMPEAVKEIINYAFMELGHNLIWCGYYDGNIKSRKCMEKCGFVYDHTEKDKPCALMGDIRTEHFTLLTREAWEAVRVR